MKWFYWMAVCSVFAATTGCGGPRIVPVEGKVLLDQDPLKFGGVMFQALEGGQPARATIQSDGTFRLGTESVADGATVGMNLVRITCYSSQDPNAPVDPNAELMLGKSLIPRRYNDFDTSGIKVEVKPSGNEPFIIELTSQE